MRLLNTSSKLTSLKNGCLLISSASALVEPSRRVGSLVNNCGRLTIKEDESESHGHYLLQDRNGVPRHGDRV
jgi:hypothetical protein